jgi:hypothetical protein
LAGLLQYRLDIRVLVWIDVGSNPGGYLSFQNCRSWKPTPQQQRIRRMMRLFVVFVSLFPGSGRKSAPRVAALPVATSTKDRPTGKNDRKQGFRSFFMTSVGKALSRPPAGFKALSGDFAQLAPQNLADRRHRQRLRSTMCLGTL